jgi:ribosomal protein S18 acetylase RimI-like enzyme
VSDIRYQLLEWDTKWFGIPIGRADLPEMTATTVAKVDEWARNHGLQCVYVFVKGEPQSEKTIVPFKPSDIRVEYEIDPLVLAKGPLDATVFMRPDEQESVCALASTVLTYTRFSRDSGFPRQRVKELYADWVQRDTAAGNPGCQVMRAGHAIVGFVTGRTDPADPTQGSIGLLGVAESCRGRGIATRLLDHACRAFIKAGVKRVRIVTQQENTHACRLYESGGHVVSRGCWYHRWYDNNHNMLRRAEFTAPAHHAGVC